MKKRSFKKSEYFLAGLIALIAGFPLAVQLPASAMDVPLTGSVTATTTQQTALDNYTNYRDSRRDYAKAQALCIQLRTNGKQVTCPDINDRSGILQFLATHENQKAVANTNTGVTVLHVTDLTLTQSNLLRRYQKINTCPTTLNEYLPGFLQLCESLLNAHPVMYKGIQSPSTTAAQSDTPQYTLDQIIKANRGLEKIAK